MKVGFPTVQYTITSDEHQRWKYVSLYSAEKHDNTTAMHSRKWLLWVNEVAASVKTNSDKTPVL